MTARLRVLPLTGAAFLAVWRQRGALAVAAIGPLLAELLLYLDEWIVRPDGTIASPHLVYWLAHEVAQAVLSPWRFDWLEAALIYLIHWLPELAFGALCCRVVAGPPTGRALPGVLRFVGMAAIILALLIPFWIGVAYVEAALYDWWLRPDIRFGEQPTWRLVITWSLFPLLGATVLRWVVLAPFAGRLVATALGRAGTRNWHRPRDAIVLALALLSVGLVVAVAYLLIGTALNPLFMMADDVTLQIVSPLYEKLFEYVRVAVMASALAIAFAVVERPAPAVA